MLHQTACYPCATLGSRLLWISVAIYSSLLCLQSAAASDEQAYADRLFARQASFGVLEQFELPFTQPDMPIIQARIGDMQYPLLFDTGTYTCLLRLGGPWGLPPVLEPLQDVAGLAGLEGKRTQQAGDTQLEYYSVPLLALGGFHLRDTVFRVYTGGEEPAADYAGAIAPFLLRQWVIEVNNSALAVRLHERAGWRPPPGARVLPLLNLPRGLFTPLVIGKHQYWFHLDTGFSGGIGLTPAVLTEQADAVLRLDGEPEYYQGWREQYAYLPVTIRSLQLPALQHLGWVDGSPLVLQDVDGIAYRDAYRELAAYNVGGIIGSGFLQRFDYAIDYELGRFYVWERAE